MSTGRGMPSVAVAILLAILLLTTGLPLNAQTPSPIRVGVIANLTGSAVRTSVHMVRGIQIAADEVNASGGIKGRPLQLVTEDSENRVQAAIEAAHKLIDVNKLNVLLMFGGSSLMLPVAQYAKTQNVIVMNISGSSPQLSEFPGTLFGVLPLNDVVGSGLGKWVFERGFRRAVTLVSNDTYGLGVQDAVEPAFTKLGGTVAAKVAYTNGQVDYRTDIQAVVRANPDVIVFAGFGDDSRKILKAARELGLNVPWYAIYPRIVEIENPSWMNGKLFGVEQGVFSLDNTTAKRFLQAYKTKFNEEPLSNAQFGYDGLWLVALAMRKAGTQVDAVRVALRQVVKTYVGATGKIEWDWHDARINAPLDRVAYQNGQFVLIK